MQSIQQASIRTRARALLAWGADRFYPFLDASKLSPAFKYAVRKLAEPGLRWLDDQIQKMSEEELRATVIQFRDQALPVLVKEMIPFLLGEEPPNENPNP